MADSLIHAYLPLLFWVGVGILLLRWLPETIPHYLGRSLYWIGVPIEIFALARQSQWSASLGLAPVLTVLAILSGLLMAGLALRSIRQFTAQTKNSLTDTPTVLQGYNWDDRPRQGSFLLSSMFGNTGFVGLAIAPAFVSEPYLGWLVFYSVTQNVFGTYGIGVMLASYFGRAANSQPGWIQVRDVLMVPSLWAFAIGASTRSISLPEVAEVGLRNAIWVVIPAALLLMGMRLSQLQGWRSLRLGVIPSLVKSLLLPGLMGLAATELHVASEARLALVLMAGMPTAFAGLILAEEYELDRELIASSIVISSGLLLVTLPLWLLLFDRVG